jgi:SlyX protein
MTEQRIDALEVKYAHLEVLVQELSSVIWTQQRELDQLREHVRQLKDKSGGDPGLVDASRTDLPPHY